jgi:hypothetical protein
MKRKLTALLAIGATSIAAATAHAGPVTVAIYAFATQADVLAFQKTLGSKCEKKWRQRKAMQVSVGAGTNACVFRSSVVADSSDVRADLETSATTSIGSTTPKKLQKKAYVGVGVRSSENAGYELRVRPGAQSWQLFRDPKGNAEGPALFKSGKGKLIRGGLKVNDLALRAFDGGTETTTLTARINGKVVVTVTDTGNGQPDGRRTTVTTGIKGEGSGSGTVGVFDNVAIKVPNPFG